MLSEVIKIQIEERFGNAIRYPRDCDALAASICTICNERVSASTLKRLFGFVKGIEEPRLFTLDLIAKYVGQKDWDTLLESLNKTESSEFKRIDELSVDTLKKGEKIEFRYEPNRAVTVEYKGNLGFTVIKSENSKLQPDDNFKTHHFVLHYPLIASDVMRKKKWLGQYIAGKVSGLTMIRKEGKDE